jgi:hypothetical protein
MIDLLLKKLGTRHRYTRGLYLVFILFMPARAVFSQASPCDKCDARYMSFINNNFNNLDETMVERFLCSLDYSCNMSPRFVDLAGKTMYTILKKKPALVVQCLSRYHQLNKKYIFRLMSSVKGNYDFIEIEAGVESVHDTSRIKRQVVNCVKMAARANRPSRR